MFVFVYFNIKIKLKYIYEKKSYLLTLHKLIKNEKKYVFLSMMIGGVFEVRFAPLHSCMQCSVCICVASVNVLLPAAIFC